MPVMFAKMAIFSLMELLLMAILAHNSQLNIVLLVMQSAIVLDAHLDIIYKEFLYAKLIQSYNSVKLISLPPKEQHAKLVMMDITSPPMDLFALQ